MANRAWEDAIIGKRLSVGENNFPYNSHSACISMARKLARASRYRHYFPDNHKEMIALAEIKEKAIKRGEDNKVVVIREREKRILEQLSEVSLNLNWL